MASSSEDLLKDVFEIYHRLFDHSAAIRGEANFFFTNFKDGNDTVLPSTSGENKSSMSQLEKILRSRQLVSEAADIDWPKIVRQSDIDKVSVKLDAAAVMIEKLVERGRTHNGAGPYGEYVEKSKQEQRKELQQFSTDIQRKKECVGREFKEKVDDLQRGFDSLALRRTPQ